jgi:hypothetical protein
MEYDVNTAHSSKNNGWILYIKDSFVKEDIIQGGIMLRTLFAICCITLFSANLAFSWPDVGDEAPDFTLEECNEGDITLSDQRGSVVLINFWEAM